MRIGLVACAKEKLTEPCKAEEMYCSLLFVKAKAYCKANYDEWYILSAKHGLIEPGTFIWPYDVTLNTLHESERRAWAGHVLHQIAMRYPQFATAEVYVHAGVNYRKYLPKDWTAPLAGLGIGQQLAWYKARGC